MTAPVVAFSRQGDAAKVIGPAPHAQMSQIAPLDLQEELVAKIMNMPGVSLAESKVSVPGARAFVLAEGMANGPPDAFQKEREFAHIHPGTDGSLHMTLPIDLAEDAYAKGWGEPHPKSGTPLIYGPRDDNELTVVWAMLQASYYYARGS